MTHGILRPIPAVVRDYAETITALDAEIGRLLETLDDLGLEDETMVVYTSDNGYMWGEHGLVDKRWAYDTSIRIPFIVRYPPLTSATVRSRTQMVLNIDLAPSLLRLAGVEVPATMHGESWLPYLTAPDHAGRESFVYRYYLDFPFPVPPIQAVRTEQYKLIDYDSRRGDELFDLRADPTETRNILRDSPELAERLRRRLADTEAQQ
jgi:N-acetylglucosamine-6-sulfatase